jgi:hypothetical protein
LIGFLGGAKMVAAGNCSNWTSKALHLAGLVDRPHTLPKSVFIDMFEEFIVRQNCPDAKVVVYLQSKAGKLSPTPTDPSQRRTPRLFDVVHGMCSPFMPVRQCVFWDICPYADAIVSIDDSELLRAAEAPFELREGEPCGGVGGLTVAAASTAEGIDSSLVAVMQRVQSAKGRITVSVRPGPALRLGWYRYAVRWRLHTSMVVTCLVAYLCYGPPCSHSKGSALLMRILLAFIGLIIHAAFA